jgi:hypothetical protein
MAALSAPGVTAIPNPPPSEQEIWGWSLIGAGAASLVAGGVISALAVKNTNDINILIAQDVIDPDRAQALRDEGDLLTALQFTGYGIGAALAVTGAVLLFTDTPQEPSVGLRPVLGPKLWGLSMGIHY